MGATYIKLGQFVASSPTLFQNKYVVEFQKMFGRYGKFEWSVIKDVIEKELGKTVGMVFESINTTPLARYVTAVYLIW